MSKFKTIGADSDSDIILAGKYISEKHAIIKEENGQIVIEDLNSTFGTHVNGKRISQPTKLKPKDRVKLGTLNFHWSDYLEDQEPEKNPIYLKNLFSPFGYVNWQVFKVILLLSLGLIIVIPIAVPAFLAFLEDRLNSRADSAIELMQLTEPLIWIITALASYIFLNLTQKAIRNKINSRGN